MCWVGGDCSTSLLIRMPLLRLWGLSFVASSLVLCLDSPDSLIWFSFVRLPHGARSPRSLRGNAAEQQFERHLGLFHFKTSQWAVEGGWLVPLK